MPEIIESSKIDDIVFNQDTVDRVLQDLMELGAHVSGGDRLGKTIIFTANKRHAQYIVERFDKLYPHLNGGFCKRIVCGDDYAQTFITDFKLAKREPIIAVSVDMLDTGIDVPEIVNLVFLKEVRFKTKFWQMIGRGTRLCQGLEVVDAKDGAYSDKRRIRVEHAPAGTIIDEYSGRFVCMRGKGAKYLPLYHGRAFRSAAKPGGKLAMGVGRWPVKSLTPSLPPFYSMSVPREPRIDAIIIKNERRNYAI